MTEQPPSDFERGRKEARTDAILEEHSRHLATINGSIERAAAAMELVGRTNLNLASEIRTLQEDSRLDRERVKVAAEVLAKETERRREALVESVSTDDRKFSKRERLVGLAISLAAIIVTVYLATH
jgi:hypothetical protein